MTFKFRNTSEISFNNNTAADIGGALYLCYNCIAVFEGNSNVSFMYNRADSEGGAIYCIFHSSVIFTGYSKIIFKNNTASRNAGALGGLTNSAITIDENTTVFFIHNQAGDNGGAMYLYTDANIIFKGNSMVIFNKNTASAKGGALACFSTVSFMDNVTINFINNKAEKNGGAIALLNKFNITFEKAKITFSNNTAGYGGAILSELSEGGNINFNMQTSGTITFDNNTALTRGNSMLIDIPMRYNKSINRLTNNLIGIDNIDMELKKHINTPPYNIKLEAPQRTLFCTECDDDTCTNYDGNASNTCTAYYMPGTQVMFGEDVTLTGCLYDFLNNTIPGKTDLVIQSNDNICDIYIPEHSLISCDSSEGFHFSITGNKTFSNNNCSIIIEILPLISLNIFIQLSPCRLGFQHSDEHGRCECYDQDDILFCTGSLRAIRRGYWLGTVEGKLTTAICPINFCNFSCCETSNGYYSLSPGRENQCTSNRDGIACGGCEEGYTLSYFAECVNVSKCTAESTVLVVSLTVLYWIAIVIGVFAMMYFKLPVGYLYAITYYYSMVDVLLGQYLYLYSSLHTAVKILSSVFKLAPQFLGQLCLAKGLSGIDVHFIHYIHPVVISIILVIISLLARCSQRLSLFIARGIVRVICFLLLLSYTSMASTSLLILRSLTFYDVDKVYTYLSPDIEYFHDRHLKYFITAVISVVTIVIGLPLILLLEPFLNHKINFTKIKPLLDQFQGCFKDQYRLFAAYYMICRLLQISVVVYSPDYILTHYILTVTSVVASLIHIIIRPYNSMILNIYDGCVLQLMVFVVVIPAFDTINSTAIVTITFALVIVPLIIFLIIGFITYKETIRKFIIRNCRAKKIEASVKDDTERPMKEFEMVVDESRRTNATICDM